MNEAIPPAEPDHSGPTEIDSCAKNVPGDWTCYNPGAEPTALVMQAAEDPASAVTLLGLLAGDCNVAVRMAVADNRSASLDTLTILARDESDDLRYQLAENHNIDDSILVVLCDDSNPFVANRAERTLARLYGAARVVHPVFDLWMTLASQTRRGRRQM